VLVSCREASCKHCFQKLARWQRIGIILFDHALHFFAFYPGLVSPPVLNILDAGCWLFCNLQPCCVFWWLPSLTSCVMLLACRFGCCMKCGGRLAVSSPLPEFTCCLLLCSESEAHSTPNPAPPRSTCVGQICIWHFTGFKY
jgi:hypothetical protein